MIGRTVRLFMADGSPLGIRQCEIFNRTIQALSVSRGRLSELRSWDEASRAGVYLLLGKAEEGEPQVYVGEAQNCLDRISQQVRDKDFWTEVILFVNKDENMHPKYLEARLINEARVAARYSLQNGKDQNVPVLSRADRVAMEEIIPDIRLITGVLGHLVFEPLNAPVKPVNLPEKLASDSIIGREFQFSGPSYDAKGLVTDEGFLILKGSTAAPRFTAGNPGYEKIRQRLLEDGVLIDSPERGRLVFERDFAANSSSQAAAIVAGGNRSGPAAWISDGMTLGQYESASIAVDGSRVD